MHLIIRLKILRFLNAIQLDCDMPKIKNDKSPKIKIEDIPKPDIMSHLYLNEKMVVDFSFEGSFASCSEGSFDNFLTSQNEFILKLREIMQDVKRLSQHSIYKLITEDGFRHCHKAKDEEKARKIIEKIFSNTGKEDSAFEQNVGCESVYQIGFQSEIRLFGTKNGNVFRVYFIDYHHDFEFDERRNTRNKKHCNFCVINSELT